MTTLHAGENLSSLLSVLEYTGGITSKYKTIEARAAEDDTTVSLRVVSNAHCHSFIKTFIVMYFPRSILKV